jgi:hypothetical protein
MDIIEEINEEITATLTEGIFQSRWFEIETYHRVGFLLIESGINPKKINIPEYVKSNSIKLYKKYPVPTEQLISIVPFGKNVSLKKLLKEC